MVKKSGRSVRGGRLRVAMVGCGMRAEAHVRALQASDDYQLVAACDIDESRLREAAERYRIPGLYGDVATMVEKVRPDLVDMVTPPDGRAGVVEAAVAGGATRVLVEKPLALRPSEAERLRRLGESVFIAVNTQYQWMPHWQRIWPQLAAGALGEVSTILCSTRTNILEQGPHVCDLALKAASLTGLPRPEWVLAAADGIEHLQSAPVPADLAASVGLGPARLHWHQGPSAPAVPGETAQALQIQVQVIGATGRLWVSLDQGWELWTRTARTRGNTEWFGDDRDAQAALFAELADRIRADDTDGFPTRIGVAAVHAEIIFACYASVVESRRIELPALLDDSVVERLERP